MSNQHDTVETLLLVWDGFGYDNGDVMRDSVRALLDAAYSSGWVDKATAKPVEKLPVIAEMNIRS